MEDNDVFLTRNVFICASFAIALNKQEMRSDKGFKGTIDNRSLQSLHGGSLEITLTVSKFTFYTQVHFQKCAI